MNDLQNIVFQTVMNEVAVSTSATANSSSVNTAGKGDVLFLVVPTTISNDATVVKVQHSADDSTWADLSGVALATLPGNTDDGGKFGLYVSRSGTAHDQYLRVVYTHGGSGSAVVTTIAMIDPQNEAPTTASGRGLVAQVIG